MVQLVQELLNPIQSCLSNMSNFQLDEVTDPEELALIMSPRGREKWRIDGLIEHKCYVEKFYNNANHLIPPDIRDEVLSIDFCKIPVGEPKESNKVLDKFFRKKGWNRSPGISDFRFDWGKDHVALEQQFRTSRDFVLDILKFQLAHKRKTFLYGIVITYDESIEIKGRNDAYIQKLDKRLKEFEGIINFKVPLWAIGLKPMSR